MLAKPAWGAGGFTPLHGTLLLDSRTVEKNRPKLTTLVARRNEIAHGQKNFIAEFRYYRTYETAVYEVMYDLALQVEERLASNPYL